MYKIIWTRSEEDWDEDKLLLPLNQVIHIPCIKVEYLPFQFDAKSIDIRSACLVFSSSHGVKSFAEQVKNFSYYCNLDTFVVGKKTDATARQFGFSKVKYIDNIKNMEDLCLHLSSYNYNTVIAPGATERAFDLIEFFKDTPFNLQLIHTYKTIGKITISNQMKNEILKDFSGCVCFASPSAVKVFCNYFTPTNNSLYNRSIAISIGQTTTKALTGQFAKIETIKTPSVLGLIELAKLQKN